MMTQQLGFSVLTAPVAAIDRRALSQAWYSALHLARQTPTCKASIPVCATKPDVAKNAEQRTQTRSSTSRVPAALHMHRESKSLRSDSQPVDRRSVRSPLARKIEHLFLQPNTTATRATFTIDGSAARVHVSMQQTRCGLRLVAVCPPHARVSVARALEQARYALAARGIAVDASLAE